MEEIERAKNIIIKNSEYYSRLIEYCLDDVKEAIDQNDRNKLRIYYFFEKLCNLLKENNILYKNFPNIDTYFQQSYNSLNETEILNRIYFGLDTIPQKVRIHLEFVQYLKFICCSSDLEEIYYRALIYELSYKVNMYQYLLKLASVETKNTTEFLQEKEKRLKVINEIYGEILKNKYFENSILYQKIKYDRNKYSELGDKEIKKINELYWYSLCSSYKNMNELFLFLTYNYHNYDGANFKLKNIELDINAVIEETNNFLDPYKTKNKKSFIDSECKTSGTLISELADKLKKDIRGKKINKDVSDKIEKLKEVKSFSDFINIVYGMLSYKIHMCDIFDEEFDIYKNSILFYKEFYITQILDLIYKFISIFYQDNIVGDYQMRILIIWLWKINLDIIQGKNLEENLKVLRDEEEKLKKYNKYWKIYQEIKEKTLS